MAGSPLPNAQELLHLHTQLQMYQDLFNHLPARILLLEVTDRAEFRILLTNRAIEEMGGFAPTETQGKLLTEILSPHDAAQAIQRIRDCIDAGTMQQSEDCYTLPTGQIWTRSVMIPLRDPTDQITRIAIVVQDITADKQQEQADRERQAALIAQQTMMLKAVSTPLLAISATTVVMPLIGTLDAQRAQQMMETLMMGMKTSQATRVILDITGVPIVDTYVANTLVRAAQAVRLLGAQVILTGIRPEIAQTLVQLGIDLSSITTRGILRDGIAYALRQEFGGE